MKLTPFFGALSLFPTQANTRVGFGYCSTQPLAPVAPQFGHSPFLLPLGIAGAALGWKFICAAYPSLSAFFPLKKKSNFR